MLAESATETVQAVNICNALWGIANSFNRKRRYLSHDIIPHPAITWYQLISTMAAGITPNHLGYKA
ncbi:MAG: hypothetical protein VKJ04_11275 [Vampirovibrionales bacterium]|nr:hypothetical protein [Vampirovibrionales bacterium]